jgi:hypothetical protein
LCERGSDDGDFDVLLQLQIRLSDGGIDAALLLLLLLAFDDSNIAGLDDGAAALLPLLTTTKMTEHQVSVSTLHLNP